MIDRKYVIQAFELNLKGRFDVLAKYYGNHLFEIPALIMVQQIKDELNITIQKHAIYNLKRRSKNKKANVIITKPATSYFITDQSLPGENS